MTAGEREAAAAAMARVRESLKTLHPQAHNPTASYTAPRPAAEPLIEMQFTIADPWQRRLFIALCRRYGHTPFRYRRQRQTTLMLRVHRSFLDRILWPEYIELRDALNEYLSAATERIIREEVFSDAREAQEQPD